MFNVLSDVATKKYSSYVTGKLERLLTGISFVRPVSTPPMEMLGGLFTLCAHVSQEFICA